MLDNYLGYKATKCSNIVIDSEDFLCVLFILGVQLLVLCILDRMHRLRVRISFCSNTYCTNSFTIINVLPDMAVFALINKTLHSVRTNRLGLSYVTVPSVRALLQLYYKRQTVL